MNKGQQTIADEILKVTIVPILDKPAAFAKLINLVHGNIKHLFKDELYHTYLNLYHLFGVIVLCMNDEMFGVSARKFIALTGRLIPQDVLKELLAELVKHLETYRDSCDATRIQFIKDLFDLRLKWLTSLQEKSGWSMPDAKLAKHPRVETFLKSNEEKMLYSGNFSDVQAALKFITKYRGTHKTFSTQMQIEYELEDSRVDKVVGVLITKTDKCLVRAKKLGQIEYDLLTEKLKRVFE